ncbi:MAG: FAD-dependent oxidoreductase [Oceanospirillaceae bacterium]|uniref:MSMEG_0569 family flavin-dependent oxidoreductase n=1 Tax=unclassified Thalassolituus TaxID=2624967 RepID=UPI000C5E4672|nr:MULTISPECIES: MSMEG_0569 family flavin-dependent oxidoreductase [unclassified Thalassolituus]MAS26156.1 FAD-dependent oxidoreductase [Oceanospirillaceae bacterium]MAY00737.1 FAD-dependent oxidoreductase [Oceanospirillaceae bacterium]MBL36188.1 FAD-dependent oxidoreductase [Oceanospirillaceae bacterium]MBS53040.1 FAD-dependent oxidoreductase [Oceanospirillaceae bacterium]
MISTKHNHVDVIIVGGGQAGLSMSYFLQQENINHVVFEKNTVLHGWKNERWDSFTLVTPNWQCDLPGLPYDGDDPKGFMTGKQTIEWLERFAQQVNAPVHEGVTVNLVSMDDNGVYHVNTSEGDFTADQIVVSSGGYHVPVIPRMAERIPASVQQLHSAQYKNAAQLQEGAVLVVGSGQSGAQIAEDLHLEGKKVFLATGDAPRVARFYRGKDAVEWLDDMGYYEMSVKQHPLGKNVAQKTNHYVTGRDGGRDIDLRKFATEGMELFGQMTEFDGENLLFKPNLTDNLKKADDTYNNINARIDSWIEQQGVTTEEGPSRYQPVWEVAEERTHLNLAESGITSIIWCIGFRPDFSWLDAAVFNGQGHPCHDRGITSEPGLYFIGLPWLHTWGSGRFGGVKQDAEYLCNAIVKYKESLPATEKEVASVG